MRPLRTLLPLMSLSVAAAAAAAAPRHVVMISVDGLMPAYYLNASQLGLEVPNLRRLMQQGAYAQGVVGVLPTVTYPSHTTLITGVPPRVHGIVSNTLFDPEGTSNTAWTWYAREVRVPTLVSAARARWLTTASVSWPVSVGLGADLLVPEFWRTGSTSENDLLLIEQLSTPRLIEAVGNDRGTPVRYPLEDEDRTDIARFILKAYRPALTLLHLGSVDHEEHEHGPLSTEARAAVERVDRQIGAVVSTLESTGMAASTLLAIVSDHGFLPVGRTLQPNVLLRQAGLLEIGPEGRVWWRAVFHADGGSAALHVKDPKDAAVVAKVRALFEPLLKDPDSGLGEILDAPAIAAMGGPAEVPLVLNAREGAEFSNAAIGGWAVPSQKKGNHGYAPDRKELYAALIVTAPGLAHRDLGVVPMTSIAPTLARYLGLTLAPEAAQPLWP